MLDSALVSCSYIISVDCPKGCGGTKAYYFQMQTRSVSLEDAYWRRLMQLLIDLLMNRWRISTSESSLCSLETSSNLSSQMRGLQVWLERVISASLRMKLGVIHNVWIAINSMFQYRLQHMYELAIFIDRHVSSTLSRIRLADMWLRLVLAKSEVHTLVRLHIK